MGRRRAVDGQAYTADEFRAWYPTTAQEFWDNAQEVRQAPDSNWHTETEWAAEQRQAAGASAEAPEPAREQALASPAAEQRQAAGAPAEAPEPAREQAPASPAAEQRQAAGAPAEAPQPARETGNFQLVPALAPVALWGASHFVTVLLPQNGRAAAGMHSCTTLRNLLEAAHAHREHLPLPADLFFNGNIRVALECPDAFRVSVESINGIRDPNRGGHNRIDILVYHRCGAVTRCHPGSTPAQSALPHTISHGSRTYSRAIALDQGIGEALHVHAPGLGGEHVAAAEHDAPPLLVTADDLADINPVDSKLVNAASLRTALARLPPGETNWSHYGFPWWVFMAGRTQNFQTIVREGIIRVTGLNITGANLHGEQTHCMRVTTRARVRVVSVNHRGRVQVE